MKQYMFIKKSGAIDFKINVREASQDGAIVWRNQAIEWFKTRHLPKLNNDRQWNGTDAVCKAMNAILEDNEDYLIFQQEVKKTNPGASLQSNNQNNIITFGILLNGHHTLASWRGVYDTTKMEVIYQQAMTQSGVEEKNHSFLAIVQ